MRDVVEVDEVRAVLGDATLVSYSRADACCTRWWSMPRAAAGRPRRCRRRRRAGAPRARRPRRPRPTSPSGAVAQRRLGVVRRSLARLDEALLAPLGVTRRLVIVSTGCSASCPGECSARCAASRRRDPVGHRVARRRDRRPVAISESRRHCRSRRRPRRGRGCVGCARLGADAVRAVVEDEATSAAFTAAMSQARVAHVAAHGVHQTETRCSCPSGSPTARCSRTNSTRAPARPSTWCSPRASWAWPQCVPATRRSG